MAISAELIERYSSEADRDWWTGLILSHSRAGTYYLCDQPSAQIGQVDGVAQTFAPVPFRFVAPGRDAEGLQQASVQICAIGGEVVALLRAANADPTERIRCRWGEWLLGSHAQQYVPLPELSLTSVVVTADLIVGSVSATDILGRPFPSVLTRIDQYPGLDRR